MEGRTGSVCQNGSVCQGNPPERGIRDAKGGPRTMRDPLRIALPGMTIGIGEDGKLLRPEGYPGIGARHLPRTGSLLPVVDGRIFRPGAIRGFQVVAVVGIPRLIVLIGDG